MKTAAGTTHVKNEFTRVMIQRIADEKGVKFVDIANEILNEYINNKFNDKLKDIIIDI